MSDTGSSPCDAVLVNTMDDAESIELSNQGQHALENKQVNQRFSIKNLMGCSQNVGYENFQSFENQCRKLLF